MSNDDDNRIGIMFGMIMIHIPQGYFYQDLSFEYKVKFVVMMIGYYLR